MGKILFIGLLFFCTNLFAAYSNNENGVPEEMRTHGNYEVVSAKLFDSFSISTNLGTITGHGPGDFVYTAGGTSTTVGSINIAASDDVLLTYNMSAFEGGTRTVRFFGKGSTGEWVDLEFDLLFTGTGTGVIKLMETGLHNIRAGINTSEIGTDAFTLIADRRRKR